MDVLLQYQKDWLSNQAQVAVWEKSRRIGASWCDAADSVLTAAARNGMDVMYTGYNQDMSREYIEDCAQWAKHFQLAVSNIGEELYDDENKDILTYRIDFSSGHKILALSSHPRNLRGKQGKITIDEAAFHDNLDGLLKAAMAILVWGGRVRIISTHNSESSAFNTMIKDVHAGTLNYSIQRTTFDEAVNDGLYDRVCLMQGEEPTVEGREAWVKGIRALYGRHAGEELDVIPASGGGDYFERAWFEIVDVAPSGGEVIRYWDRAATEPSAHNPDPDWTAGVKIRKVGGIYYVEHVAHKRLTPHGVENLVENTASQDGHECQIGIEQDPGQAGKADGANYVRLLAGYNVRLYPVSTKKEVRAKAFSAQAEAGNVKLVRGPWNEAYLAELSMFPNGTHDDQVDGSSGAFNALTEPTTIVVTSSRSRKQLIGGKAA